MTIQYTGTTLSNSNENDGNDRHSDKSTPYERFGNGDLILRDELAIDRTLLANERTFLAYLRAGVTLMLAGVTFIHFGSDQWLGWIGYTCVPIGVVIMAFGGVRYRTMKDGIAKVRQLSR